ncbi:MAG: NAD(P)H-dependent glycerol-3-phosphate dehydrogenase [Psittacicella sp.]
MHSSNLCAIIGSGSFGASLAISLSHIQEVYLWGRNKDKMNILDKNRAHPSLPNIIFPSKLIIENNLGIIFKNSKYIIIAVPSFGFNETLKKLKPFINSNHYLVITTKGIDPINGRLMQQVIEETLGNIKFGILSGPTFAKEIASNLPTAITLASKDLELATKTQIRFHKNPNMSIYLTNDTIGVQLGGATKNIIAIATGILDGAGFGANARTSLITRGLVEIKALGVKLGAHERTFNGMSGIGDLILTCTDNQSRNRRLGILLGQKTKIKDAIKEIEQVSEGYYNTKEIYSLAFKNRVSMPITEAIYKALYCEKDISEVIDDLLTQQNLVEP